MKNKDSGFSLAEMMIVLAVLALSIGLAVQLARGSLWSTELQAAGELLSSEIAAARARAIAQNARFRLTFDETNKSYALQKQVSGTWVSTGSARPIPNSLQFVTTQNIVFLSNGILEAAGTIRVKNQKDEMIVLAVTLGGQVELTYSTWTKSENYK